MSWLRGKGIGLGLREQIVPIVPTAVIFDISIGGGLAYPTERDAFAACQVAGAHVAEGSVGAGTGATVAKWAGPEHRRKGGLGTASARVGDVVVGAVVVCNAVGDVVDERGDALAAANVPPGTPWASFAPTNTILGAVVTNAGLDKRTCAHIARMGAAGFAQAVRPAFTFFDGDVVFCAATGEVDGDPAAVGSVVADVVADALRRGVRAAGSLGGVPGLPG
jgi:L-aminopeptidase/D-esterase-like protein